MADNFSFEYVQGNLDRSVFRESNRITAGASAFHALDPSELVMQMEEANADPLILAGREREALRVEVFSGLAEYLFADGPAPNEVRERIEGFLISFQPEIAITIKGDKRWVDDAEVAAVLKKYQHELAEVKAAARSRGALSTWARELDREVDLEFIREVIVKLIAYLLSQGRRWKTLTAVAYCLAKSLRPHLIAGMSLEDIAVLSGDSGRATAGHRAKRLYTWLVEAAGARACHVHFQKSAETVEKYSRAQLGNRNRSGRRKRRKA
jgi:hypothetical protein